MHVFRITRAGMAALDGEGARLYGGRWNSPGRPAVYASETRALAALEYLIHVDVADVPPDLVLLTVELPDDGAVRTIAQAELPERWEQIATPPECRVLGDAWLTAADELALAVPSAAVPEERNIILNPRHPRSDSLRVVRERPLFFDPRLIP